MKQHDVLTRFSRDMGGSMEPDENGSGARMKHSDVEELARKANLAQMNNAPEGVFIVDAQALSLFAALVLEKAITKLRKDLFEASNAPTQPAQVHQQSDPAGIMQMVDTLIASVNEAHHASSEGGATQPFASRLEEIRATPAGWYDDENPAPSPAAVEAMRFLLVDVSMQPVPLPHLYPLPSGGIAAEWTIGAWEASAEVNETGSQVTLNAVTALTEQGAGEVVSDPYDDAVQKDRIDRIIARMNDMMTNYRNSQHERNKKDEHITLPSPYGPFVKFELQHKSDDDWRSFAVFYTGEATQGEIRGYGSSPELALEQIKQRYLDRDNWVYYGYSEYPI